MSTGGFARRLTDFCDNLTVAFPELKPAIDRTRTLAPDQVWSMWKGSLHLLISCDALELFKERKGLLLGAVRLTSALWGELNTESQQAIWKHLRCLILDVASVIDAEKVTKKHSEQLLRIVSALQGSGTATAGAAEPDGDFMASMFKKLKEVLGEFGVGGSDVSGGNPDVPDFPDLPEIPDRLRNGKIAKLAEEFASQFDPAEFGLNATDLSGTDLNTLFDKLSALDPDKLKAGAARMADKLKTRILGGSLNREELISEARDFVELFKEHPFVKRVIESVGGMDVLTQLFKKTETSDRVNAVRERLRRKHAAKHAKKGP